jgi:hypothetical protein
VQVGFSQDPADPGKAVLLAFELAHSIASNAPPFNFTILLALPRIAASGEEAGFFTEALMSAIASTDEDIKSRPRALLVERASKVPHNG